MVSAPNNVRVPWEDRFRRPSTEDLHRHYDQEFSQLLDQARARLLEFDGINEELAWQGLPWRWTLIYRREQDPPRRAWAYLIPHRDKPLIASPITEDLLEQLPRRRLTKFVREAIDEAKRVGEVRWVVWEIGSHSQLDNVLDLLKRKYKLASSEN